MIKRRSLLRAFVLGTAMAFPAAKLRLAEGGGFEQEYLSSSITRGFAGEFMKSFEGGRVLAKDNTLIRFSQTGSTIKWPSIYD